MARKRFTKPFEEEAVRLLRTGRDEAGDWGGRWGQPVDADALAGPGSGAGDGRSEPAPCG